MKIAVLIKQVPSSEAKIRVGGDGRSIDTDGVEYVVNPPIRPVHRASLSGPAARVFGCARYASSRLPTMFTSSVAHGWGVYAATA